MFLHTFTPSPVIFSLGPLSFHWYGLLMMVAIIAGYWLTRRHLDKLNLPLVEFERLVVWLVLAGLLGARLIDVLFFEWWYFKDNWLDILAIWQGGLSWHGGVGGALVVLAVWCRKERQSIWVWLKVLAPAAALGQAIGRWGNYFNQELFGQPTNLPWGIPISLEFRPTEYSTTTYFHPVFLYESVGLIILTIILLALFKRLKASRLVAVYLVGSGLLRGGLELIRLDQQMVIAGWRIGMILALLSVIIGLIIWWQPQRFVRFLK